MFGDSVVEAFFLEIGGVTDFGGEHNTDMQRLCKVGFFE
jgi:hypothetical protein